jgi:hypothetical protein
MMTHPRNTPPSRPVVGVDPWSITLLYILLNSLVWWIIFSTTRHYLDHADMVENYAWGIQGTWGNNKHPPLLGWIVAAWFTLLPTTDWAYYLLNEINLALALLFLACALRRILPPEKILIAIVLTTFITQWGPDSGYKYNANSALFPWITGFLWAMTSACTQSTHARGYFLLAGLFAGAALLTKYYAAILLLAIFLSVLYRLYGFRSKRWFVIEAIGISGTVALILTTPHWVWSWNHHWPSLHYMHNTHHSTGIWPQLKASGQMLLGTVLFASVMIILWGLSFIRAYKTSHKQPLEATIYIGRDVITFSLVLTVLIAAAQQIQPVASWMIPALLFSGWGLLSFAPPTLDFHQHAKRIVNMGLLYLMLMSMGAAILEYRYRQSPGPSFYELPYQIAQDVTQRYHQTYQQPIQYVGGSFPLPYVLSFYSTDHPSSLYGLDLEASTWINPTALKQGNKVVICGIVFRFGDHDPNCIPQAIALFGKPDQIIDLHYRTENPQRQSPPDRVSSTYTALFWHPITHV